MELPIARILLVYEKTTVSCDLADVLRHHGYQCDPVAEASAALQALHRQAYDALLVCLFGEADLEPLRLFRRTAAALPLILITARPSITTAVEAVRLAAVDYLIQPINVAELLQSVQRAVAQHQSGWILAHTMEQSRAWLDLEPIRAGPPASSTGITPARLAWTFDQYLAQVVSHIARLTLQLGQTLMALGGTHPASMVDVCTALQCPRQQAYRDAIADAINVIWKTRQAFKSKDLEALRTRLETVLRAEPTPPGVHRG